MSLEQTVGPAVEPVTLAEIKAYLRIADVAYSETGEATSAADFDNLTSPLTLVDAVTSYPQMSFTQGTLLKIDNEIMQVWSVVGNDVTFGRGQEGTLIAAHTADETIYIVTGYTSEDDDLNALIAECRQVAEEDTWRQFVTATWVLRLDAFPSNNGDIIVPKPPLQSVSSIKYYDTDGVQQTLVASGYDVDSYGGGPGIVRPAYGEIWPSTRAQLNAIEITFIAGYTTVPWAICKAIKILVADAYKNRESEVVGQGWSAMPLRRDAEYWLGPYRVHDVRLTFLECGSA